MDYGGKLSLWQCSFILFPPSALSDDTEKRWEYPVIPRGTSLMLWELGGLLFNPRRVRSDILLSVPNGINVSSLECLWS
ncbi:hypothetical protein TNCV_3930701 [Trichonephila clavipes]|nr:hypothetical protein TNCV_3930701 [Trichonephila clavipes]